MVAAQSLYLEAGRGVQHDRSGVVGPHLQVELVRVAGHGVVDDCRDQRLAPSSAPRFRQNRHAQREDTGDALLDTGGAEDLGTFLEYPHRRRSVALEQPSKALRTLVEIDRWLGAQHALRGDLRDDQRHRGGVLGSRRSHDHWREG